MSISFEGIIDKSVRGIAVGLAAAFLMLLPSSIRAADSAATAAPMPGAVLSSGADPAKVLLAYAGINAQAEITSPSGIHVYIDVHTPSALTTKPGPNDILCYTHNHYYHRNLPFQKSFPGRVIDQVAGEYVFGDLRIICIPGSHMEGDKIGPGVSSDYFYLIETGGLRILHTGDIGQLQYHPDQLKAFGGRIDLLFQEFDNGVANMSVENGLGFELLTQLGPRLIIPTHTSPAATEKLLAEYPALFSEQATVELSASALPEKTTVLFTGQRAVDAWKANLERGVKK